MNMSNQSIDRINNSNNNRNKTNVQPKIQDMNFNVLPSQKNMLQKENIILSIETKLYTLHQEKDKVYINLFKFNFFSYHQNFQNYQSFLK